MLPLYLLAAHMVGDFVLQTRWQAAGKLADSALRTAHVFFYGLPFLPILLWRLYASPRLVWWYAPAFLALLLLLHYATDSRRFRSTVGDWIGWNLGAAGPPAEKRGVHAATGAPLDGFELPPNPWAPMPILIDQTLHVCQLALLGGLFLS